MQASEDLEAIKWRKVRAPKPWRPEAGEVLIGRYAGKQLREGQYGPYNVFIVRALEGTYLLSGTVLNDLFAGVFEGDAVQVHFLGMQQFRGGEYKDFNIFVEERA